MIDTAIRDALAADATLVALLGTYRSHPAIFVQGDVPADYERASGPYIALQDGSAGDYLDGDRDFFTAPCEVFVLGMDTGDAAAVETAAWRVRTVLDGAAIAPAGYTAAGTSIESGPTPDDPDDLTFGRRLRVLVGLIEN